MSSHGRSQEGEERAARPGGPVVVYVAGSGRSGSTLLERALGAIPGFVNVGELIDLPRRVARDDERCGCGEPFSGCVFWQQVGASLPEGWSAERLSRLSFLQGKVARQRYIPRHLAPLKAAGFAALAQEYRQEYRRLYSAIAAAAGAGVVVDASKWPAQALALSGGDIDLRVVHLVRDVRGVAWSLGKRDVPRPQVTRRGSEADVMYSQGVVTAASRWVACQSEVSLALRDVPKVTVRYENLVRDARYEIAAALTALGLGADEQDLAHIGRDRVTLGRSHGLSGNPSRFREGVVELRADERWRRDMPALHRHVAVALATPWTVGNRPGRPAHTAASAAPTATEVD